MAIAAKTCRLNAGLRFQTAKHATLCQDLVCPTAAWITCCASAEKPYPLKLPHDAFFMVGYAVLRAFAGQNGLITSDNSASAHFCVSSSICDSRSRRHDDRKPFDKHPQPFSGLRYRNPMRRHFGCCGKHTAKEYAPKRSERRARF